MEIILLLLLALYSIMLIWFLSVWHSMGRHGNRHHDLPVKKFSVIIPFRNEENRIGSLLSSLEDLDYPDSSYEVIFVNDRSCDETVMEIEKKRKGNWKIIHLPNGRQGKKIAVEFGVQTAAHDLIVMTDADCIVPEGWLRCLSDTYASTGALFISGPLRLTFNPWSLLQVMQYFEQTALTAIGGITMFLGNPTMCNGANMSFSKKAYYDVDGFVGNNHIPTGDDQFLLKKMANEFPRHITFLKQSDAVVTTSSLRSWSDLFQQRIRWASKWKATGGTLSIMAVFIGLIYILLSTSVILAPITGSWPVLLAILGVKTLIDAIFVKFAGFGRVHTIAYAWWPLIQLLYPLYVVRVIAGSFLGSYSWKDRQYSAVGSS